MPKVAGWIAPVAKGLDGRFSHENNDCCVRALKNASGMTYEDAHSECKQYGRKNNDGMQISAFHRMLKAHDFECTGTFGTTQSAVFLRVCANLPSYKGMTLANAMKIMQNGSFVVWIRGHAFAVVDGDLIDQGPERAAASVVAIWKKAE